MSFLVLQTLLLVFVGAFVVVGSIAVLAQVATGEPVTRRPQPAYRYRLVTA
jgi:uncharacterized membrane protein